MAQYKVEPHSFHKKMLHWQYCSKCGVLRMKNGFSEWAVKMGCNYHEHPSYESQRAQTNPFK